MSSLDEGLLIAASDAIRERLGLSFRRERWRELEAGLHLAAPALGLQDAGAAARWVASRPVDEGELKVLAQSLTVGETYFCRDANVFHGFEKEILPPLIAARRQSERRLRIWSAACCTGEEPYTIAMILRRAIRDLDEWNVTILATDVNLHFLARAEEGTYGEWSFRRTPPWMRRRHFRDLGGGRWQIDADLRRLVSFAFLNLADVASYPSVLTNTNAMDVVFCRNVLMYFDASLVAVVADRLHASLLEGGWLAVGRSEAVATRDDLSLRAVDGEQWYRKQPPADRPPAHGAARAVPRVEQVATSTGQHVFPGDADVLYARGEYAAACVLLRDYLAGGGPRGPERRRAMRLLAHACANLGRLAEAQTWCEEALAENKLDPRLHYLLASVLLELDQIGAAEESLHHALAIDETFVLAHFTLGNLARRRDGRRIARDHYERTLFLLRRYLPNEVLPESDGMTARNLSEITHLALAQC